MSWYLDLIDEMEAKKIGVDLKEVRYMQGIQEGLTGAESAKRAGYGVAAQRTPRKLIETPELKARMQESLIRKRVTLDSIAETVAKSMKANVLVNLEDGPAESDIADHKVRLKAAEAATKLWGLGDVVRDGQAGSTITLTLAGPLAERIAARMAGPMVIEGDIT